MLVLQLFCIYGLCSIYLYLCLYGIMLYMLTKK